MGGRGWFGRGNRQWKSTQELKDEIYRRGIRIFSQESIRVATRDFKILIGEVGCAKVYLGVLEDDTEVAIKVLNSEALDKKNEFLVVIDVISHIQHKNLNRVIGCCVDNGARMVVSEYIENGTLYDLIGDSDRRRSIFSWKTRLDLCIGIARGISYLHQDIHPRVIHRDIKTANILLDINLTPKITDFELIGFVYGDEDLPLLDYVMGSCGYLDPEYFKTSEYTEKVDVYAFGVVMLEVISGRRAIVHGTDYGDTVICYWASRLASSDRRLEVVDHLLVDFPRDDVLRFIDVALLCTQPQPERRPSMSEVLLMLSGVCNRCIQSLGKLDMNVTTVIQGEVQPQGDSSYDDSAESQVHVHHKQQMQPQAMMTQPGIPPSGSGDLGQRLSQTMVFPKHSTNICPEAVYPPFQTRVFRRLGSRNLYSFQASVQSQGEGVETCTVPQGREQRNTTTISQVIVQQQQQQLKKKMMKLGIVPSGSADLVQTMSQTRVFTKHSTSVCPEAVYPPFRTRVFQRQGSRNLCAF